MRVCLQARVGACSRVRVRVGARLCACSRMALQIPQHKQPRHWDGRPPGLGSSRSPRGDATCAYAWCTRFRIPWWATLGPSGWPQLNEWRVGFMPGSIFRSTVNTTWRTPRQNSIPNVECILQIIKIRRIKNIYKFSFLLRTIIDWNSLSPHSVDSPSIDTFRARITRN